jgi:hypothetical protein
LLASSGKAALRSGSGGGEDEIELSPGIHDSSGESFFGSVDLNEKVLLVSIARSASSIVAFLELCNSSFYGGTLLGHISDERISLGSNVDLGISLCVNKSCFNTLTLGNEPVLK